MTRALWLDDSLSSVHVGELGSLDQWGLELYSLGKMEAKEQSAVEAKIEANFNRLRSLWPKTPVTGDKLLSLLVSITPLAKKISDMKVGKEFKIKYLFHSGSKYKITEADKKAADSLLYEINTRLPTQYKNKVVEPWLMSQIKASYMQVALTGPYLESPEFIDKLASEYSRAASAISESATSVVSAISKGSEAIFKAIPWWMKLTGGIVAAGALFFIYGEFKHKARRAINGYGYYSQPRRYRHRSR